MTRQSIFIFSLFLFAILERPSIAKDDPPKDPLPGVQVKLTISVEEYDPSKPSQGVVRCVVSNKSKEALEITLGCDPRTNRLAASSEGNRDLELWPRPILQEKDLQHAVVRPAEDKCSNIDKY